MTTITIPKKEYRELLDRSLRYQYLKTLLEEDIFGPPPTKDSRIVVKEFSATKRYSKNFLDSFAKGLERSPYFQK